MKVMANVSTVKLSYMFLFRGDLLALGVGWGVRVGPKERMCTWRRAFDCDLEPAGQFEIRRALNRRLVSPKPENSLCWGDKILLEREEPVKTYSQLFLNPLPKSKDSWKRSDWPQWPLLNVSKSFRAEEIKVCPILNPKDHAQKLWRSRDRYKNWSLHTTHFHAWFNWNYHFLILA